MIGLTSAERSRITHAPGPESGLKARGSETRLALIRAAEILFADHGIDGVGVRQIARAAGSANSNVVAYHFGGKEELAAAVILHRLPPIEARRAELLKASEGWPRSIVGLLDILYRPLVEQRDEQGMRSYARFLAGIGRSGGMAVRSALSAYFPVTQQLIDALRSAMPDATRPSFDARLQVAAAMIHTTIAMMDDGSEGRVRVPDFNDLMSMAAAALAAPMTDDNKRCTASGGCATEEATP